MTSTESIQFTPQWPHGEIQEVFKDVFFVTGTNKTHHEGVEIQTSRNMVIIRNGTELTLVNTVRLSQEGLAELKALGVVSYILRVGAFHGRDDAFYKNQYPNAQLLTLEGMTYESGLKPDRELTESSQMPFPDFKIFVFKTSKLPEGVLRIDRDGGILITCDSIQNITCADAFYSDTTFKAFEDQGLVKPANISSIWLGATETKASDFDRLLKMDFSHLITAHGEPLKYIAHEKVDETVKRVFQ